MKVFLSLLIAFVVAFSLDGASKIWAEQALEPHQPVPVIGETFRFTLGYNTGVAFGMFSNGGSWPLIITGVVIFGLIVWVINVLRQGKLPPPAGAGLGLLLGGAIGNFVDRVPDGRVTDFLDVGIGTARWPTFNLADSFILVGLGILLLIEMTTSPPKQEAPEEIETPLKISENPVGDD